MIWLLTAVVAYLGWAVYQHQQTFGYMLESAETRRKQIDANTVRLNEIHHRWLVETEQAWPDPPRPGGPHSA